MNSGLLLIDKPLGWTSARVVAHLKKILEAKKVGHCGTLDPRASGVLVVCFGSATKCSGSIMEFRKTYRGTMRLGITTTTGDLDGDITGEQAVAGINADRIGAVIGEFRGKISQIPPMFSALKVRGRKLYELARKGLSIDRAPRTVEVYSFDILRQELPDIEFRVVCSKGTYVRTLAEDIGRRLGCGAVLVALAREAVGPYTLDRALAWDSVCAMNQEQLLSHTIPA